MKNNKTVVITGCLSFIGFHTTCLFLREGWRVYGIDKQTYASNENLLENLYNLGQKNVDFYDHIGNLKHPKTLDGPWNKEYVTCFKNKQQSNYVNRFSYIKQDICDLESIPDCQYVINICAESHVGNSIQDCSQFIKTNVDGVRNLLELIKNKPDNVRSKPVFIQCSTDEVYGDIEEGKFTEESPLNPSNPYAASKASADLLVKSYARTYGIKYRIVRPTNNYGTHQYPEKFIPLVIKLLQEGLKIRLHDEGKPRRNWLHVEDTAKAMLIITEKGGDNEIYNVAGTDEKTNLHVAELCVNSFLNREHKPLTKEEKLKYFDLNYKREGQDVRYAICDKKLRNLGWKPEKKFDNEIKNIVKFYKNNFRW